MRFWSLFPPFYPSAIASSPTQATASVSEHGDSFLQKKRFLPGAASSRRLLTSFGFFCLSFSVSVPSYATIYYVSNQGNDGWPGTSSSQPWRSIDRVNKQDLNAGDQVLFKGGQTFSGSLSLPKSDSGTRTNPVIISSYGVGPAWISSGSQTG